MTHFDFLQGRVVGLGNAHAADEGLHRPLLSQLGLETPVLNHESARWRGATRRGDLGLARDTARWVTEHDIDVLVTPPADHTDHRAAGLIARLAAKELAAAGYELWVLVPLLGAAILGPTMTPAPGSRSPDQPLLPSDFTAPAPPPEHQPWTGDYQLLAPGGLATKRATILTLNSTNKVY